MNAEKICRDNAGGSIYEMLEEETLCADIPNDEKSVRPANKSQVEIQEIYAGRNKRTQSCHFASAIKDGGSP